jgi:hypothetical protein
MISCSRIGSVTSSRAGSGSDRLDDASDRARLLFDLEDVARTHEERRDVDAPAVDLEVAVAHQLAAFGVIADEPGAVHDVVETALEQLDQIVAGDALHARGFVVVAAKLALGDSVDSFYFLLLAQLLAVVRALAAASLAVLTGRVRAALVATLVRVAALAFEKQLHIFAPAEPTDGTDVPSHLSPQTRRRLGGRQPLWGMGVQSRMSEILKPADCRARRADSRPAPGPVT